MSSSKNAGKVTVEVKFRCAVWTNGVGSNYMQCWMHKRCGGVSGKLKEGSKFKCLTCTNQQTDIAEDCLGIELNSQLFEIVENVLS